ncbi:hypothetical protein [Burkholderia multivorans]|uniref:hypothetical protein n=1 Tax=Burkholderia multivorans TaxID=87883 RepID=UPI001C23DFEC|nr:hypothetical protein [Burkholderia multivorans]MBU9418920.1 hypothetical protein [Burkholderia multivorans]MDR8762371.1 hypothetical protein [Burkholderia multivorans]MDR8769032.1 hypothetical protein [Burkholderia multivorans]MDR8774300.1 hypothetical protein [Burkholderia multivorans]MDR8792597.1 hypothetical protein [Burkholderia multivorans]
MKRLSLMEEMRKRTENVPSTSEISIVPSNDEEGERWFPRTGVGATAAWATALARINVLEEALHKAHVEIGNEAMHQEGHGLKGMKGKLTQAWNRIDWLEGKLREHGLGVPSSGT